MHATGNFAYSSTHATGERYLMLGDAFTFIDPMFSSGVFLAMQSAFDGAELVATALDRPAELRGGAPGVREAHARGPARLLVVHLPRHQPDDPRHVHAPAATSFKVKQGADVAAGRRHLRQARRLWRSLRMFKVLYYFISLAQLRAAPGAGWKRHRFNIRDMGTLQGETIQSDA